MKRKRRRVAYLIPAPGGWSIMHRGEIVLADVDRSTAEGWAASRGLRLRSLAGAVG